MAKPEELRRLVSALAADVGVRTYRHHEQLRQAADLISREFESAGYAVSKQSFLFEGNSYDNIIAELTGAASEKMLILGAHYDTVENTPGADDNASGVAALLGIAQDLAGRRLARTVRFSAFALEELPVYRTHHMGSYHYARMLKQTGAAVEGMICLEMVGYFTDLPGSQSYPLPIFKLKYPSRGNLSRWSGTRGPGHLRKGWLQECAQRSTCLS